jgi:hypothetical protein
MAVELSGEQFKKIDKAIRECLSATPLKMSELASRVEAKTQIPWRLFRNSGNFLMYLGRKIVELDEHLNVVLGPGQKKIPPEQRHKFDLCGVPQVDIPVLSQQLPLSTPMRCRCCGAVLVLSEYSSVAITTTMAIPRLYRLMCPECP